MNSLSNLLAKASLLGIGAAVGAWFVAPDDVHNSVLETASDAFTPAAAYAKEAQPTFSPVKALVNRDVNYPGTEDIAPDEMRVTACGTGMPNARPAQAAACFLVELGNGDKFIFDIGSGSFERLSALVIPFDYLDKVFIGHLHSDHIGDLDGLWVGGVIGNRQRPLRVWGPSGPTKELGTAYAVEGMKQMLAWEAASRLGNVNTLGQQIEMNEFDYKLENQIIYEENDVVIRTMPAVHALDGPVSFTLSWNDMMFAFSSDTYPNKWWLEHTKGADIAIHEAFNPPRILVDKQRWPVADSLNVGPKFTPNHQCLAK